MKIIRNSPAGRLGEAFPIGNGRLGGMVYGGITADRIDLSEETFFSGNYNNCNYQPGAKAAFYQMRGETLAGKFPEALRTAAEFIGVRNNYGTNLPVGQLRLAFQYGCKAAEDYRRMLNINSGVVREEFRIADQNVKRQAFASHPHKCLIYETTVDEGTFSADLIFESPREADSAQYQDGVIRFCCQALEQLHSDGTTGVSLCGTVYIDTDGAPAAGASWLTIVNASKIRLFLQMFTNFEDPCLTVSRMQSSVDHSVKSLGEMDFKKISAAHAADISEKMNRVKLEINSTDTGYDFPLMFQYGRYLLLCSSREDSRLPAHLQGVWNDNVACRIGWSCDMHLDINTQMNYWPAEVGSIPEANVPLFCWIRDKLVPEGRKTAKECYGLKGWVAELVSNQYGYSAPYWAEQLAPCPTGGVWLITHLWEHFLYTEDVEFLRKTAFPVIAEAVLFFSDYVFMDPKTGYMVGGPSISPENGFRVSEGQCWMSIGTTYEMLMIRQLYQIYLEACGILKEQSFLYEKVKDQLGRLLPYTIDQDGCLKEWLHDYPPNDRQHRHTSHLLGIFPFHQITPSNQELSAAAVRVIDQKLSPIENWEDTGWARAMLVLYEARLKRPSQAYYHLKSMMDSLLEVNNMIIHPPTRGADSFDNVYELDGNTGLTTGIAEMLLQSQGGVIEILPSIPMEWKSGRVCGLKARGSIEVEIVWQETFVKTTLVSKRTKMQTVIIGGEKRRINLIKGEPISIRVTVP